MKAVLLDIDFALTNIQKVIKLKTKEVLMKATSICLVIVFARTENGLVRFSRELDF